MKILILHLSDIHLCAENTTVFSKIEGVAGTIRSFFSEYPDLKKCFILVSGDVANKGKDTEYDIGLDLFSKLKVQLSTIDAIDEITYIIVPGNHDCYLKPNEQDDREALISRILEKQGPINQNQIDDLITVQDNFFDFLSKFASSKRLESSDRIFWKTIVPVDKYKVCFYCLNTSYISQEHEKQGQLVFPVDLLTDTEKYDLSIALFHHPDNWLESVNRRIFKRQIEKMADVVYTGHEHESDVYDVTKVSVGSTEFLEGDRLQTPQNDDSGFNCEIYDLSNCARKTYHYQWNGKLYTSNRSPNWVKFTRKELLMAEFTNNPEYLKELSDIGTGFSHPRVKDALKFDDIYVPPELLELKIHDNKSNPLQKISSKELTNYVLKHKNLMIVGPELSGKSMLSKGLYKIFQKEHYVPILIDGSEIVSNLPEQINQTIYDLFSKQYSNEMLETFKACPKSRKALVIDSFDHSTRLNAKGKRDFITHVQNMFDNVVILGTEIIEIEDMLSLKRSSTISFTTCELSEFFPSKRSELIERWINLGQEYQISPEELKYKIKTCENTVNSILKDKLLPPFPFVILTILQTIDANVQLETGSGAYGHLFQHIITQSIGRSSKDVHDLNLKFNYLSAVAYYMLTRNISTISDDNIKEIDQIFHDKHDFSPRGSGLLDELSNVPVIRRENENYRFRYAYLYHFFVARYMHRNLRNTKETEHIKERISIMIKNVYKHDYASIVTFLCYFSADPLVYDSILENARAIFKKNEPCNLEQDTLFIKLPRKPAIKVIDNDVNETRRDLLVKDDLVEMNNHIKEEFEKTDDVADIESLNIVNTVNLALRTVDILGQILRNFSTDLTKETKMALAEECYYCGLRTLTDFLHFFSENIDDIRKEFFEAFREEYETDPKHIVIEKVDEKIFGVCMIISLAIIKKISFSVGEENLKETYKKVLEKCGTVAVKLIDVSIKLDHFKNVPTEEIKSVYKIVEHNPLSAVVLQLLVIQNALKYRWDYKTRQSIFAQIGVKIADPKFRIAPSSK